MQGRVGVSFNSSSVLGLMLLSDETKTDRHSAGKWLKLWVKYIGKMSNSGLQKNTNHASKTSAQHLAFGHKVQYRTC